MTTYDYWKCTDPADRELGTVDGDRYGDTDLARRARLAAKHLADHADGDHDGMNRYQPGCDACVAEAQARAAAYRAVADAHKDGMP